jgi:enamine deaminase RidA (YjgF/YER057c/UK114 family)
MGSLPCVAKWRLVSGHVITGCRTPAQRETKQMTIKRHEPAKILSKVVEANGFVFTAGITADDPKQDAKGQAQQILKEIDRLLGLCGTDKSKVVSATIWVSDIRHRDAMNESWNAWTGGQNLPGRACIEAKLADPRLLVEIAVVAAK